MEIIKFNLKKLENQNVGISYELGLGEVIEIDKDKAKSLP